MKLISFFLFITINILSQTIDPKFEKEILLDFANRNYKRCVDEGVKYLIQNGSDELKKNILFAKRNLEAYNPSKFVETDSLIEKIISLLPKMLPNYAIYAGLAEVTFWMMYNYQLPIKDQRKIIDYSFSYFRRAIENTPTDSTIVLSKIFIKAADISEQYGDEESKISFIRKAFELNPNDYWISNRLIMILENENKLDSCEIILTNLYQNQTIKSEYGNVYDYIGDNLSEVDNRSFFYKKALKLEPKNKGEILKKLGDLYFGEESIPYYLEALKYDAKNDDILISLGFRYNLLGEYDKSISYYEKIKNWDNKSNFVTSFHSGIIGNYYFYQKSDFKKALEYYKRSNDLFQQALCYYNLNNFNMAIDKYKAELANINSRYWMNENEKNEFLAGIHYNIGLCYIEIKDKSDAYNSFETSYNYSQTEKSKYYKEIYKIASKNVNWDIVNYSNSTIYLVDKKRITKNGNRIKVWIKQELFPIEKELTQLRTEYINENELDPDKYKTYNHTLIYLEVDCKRNQTRPLQKIDYNETGNTLQNNSFSESEFTDVVPESIGEGWVIYLCEGKYK